MTVENKSCGNCANCFKDEKDGKPNWSCEEYGFFYVGMPVSCSPPNDEACKLWTDDPKKANSWVKYV